MLNDGGVMLEIRGSVYIFCTFHYLLACWGLQVEKIAYLMNQLCGSIFSTVGLNYVQHWKYTQNKCVKINFYLIFNKLSKPGLMSFSGVFYLALKILCAATAEPLFLLSLPLNPFS